MKGFFGRYKNGKESRYIVPNVVFGLIFAIVIIVMLVGLKFELAPLAILNLIFFIWTYVLLKPSSKSAKPRRKVLIGLFMGVLYGLGLIFALVFSLMLHVIGTSLPIRYPSTVKELKANSSIYEVFPDKIPKEASHVLFDHANSFLQGKGHTYIEFDASGEYIEAVVDSFGSKAIKLKYVPDASKYCAISKEKYVSPSYDPDNAYMYPEKYFNYQTIDVLKYTFYDPDKLSKEEINISLEDEDSEYVLNLFKAADAVRLPEDGTMYLLYDNDNWNHHSCVGFWVNADKTRIKFFEY